MAYRKQIRFRILSEISYYKGTQNMETIITRDYGLKCFGYEHMLYEMQDKIFSDT